MAFGDGLRSETREIEGIVVTATQLPPLRALALMPRLGKVMAPLLALDGVTAETDVESLVPVILKVLDSLEDDQAVALVRDLLASSTAQLDGKLYPLNTDSMLTGVFGGNVMAMVKAAVFAVEVNFGDFFAKGLAAKRASNQAAVSPSTSTTISPMDG
jgi:hypothetical protein